ncbi:MAG: hypothetical protein IKC59_08415 [Clostridia bacterium]|nr:hypothetical protein [Clostridia bacterium]MBR7099424.1 hypothetical protein [Clostridia bacterium]
MSVLILKPEGCHSAYAKAAEITREMYRKVTGTEPSIAESDDLCSDLIVIGSDNVNDFAMNEILCGNIQSFDIRYGTDDYCLHSYKKGDRRILVLAGGRGRSTVYAVYDLFERFGDCHYFWDGDVIPHKDLLSFDDFHIVESPRFDYRGLRYFAHRGLKRFQAEHWSFDDWQAELDWMMKKRLNFFMLRIGMDDVWQRAFPDIVKYPDTYNIIENEEGYNNRSDFWTLRYRGELRERILSYARELDLIYPTDCGTMTHWYSRTPVSFLENRKPDFLVQANRQYVESDTGKVFDFRKKENMQHYMQLTRTMVNEYEKRNDYFHTIGLGERMIYDDPQKNLALKLIAYRRITEALRNDYPNSTLFLATWDFIGWWSPDDVKKLVAELDPSRTVVLDYTSEVDDPDTCFLNWGVVHRFPWVFGLFHAYESESELRGPYRKTAERLSVAAEDPYCKGMILWPELSHSDPIVLEYLSENAWSPLKNTIEETVEEFCKKRYGVYADEMNSCWQDFLPFMMQGSWGGYSKRAEDDEHGIEYYNKWLSHSDFWATPLRALRYQNDLRFQKQVNLKVTAAKQELDKVIGVIERLAELPAVWEHAFMRRDAIDIIRTAAGRILNFLIGTATYEKDHDLIKQKRALYLELYRGLEELLGTSKDFSMYHTLLAVKETAPTNPNFEATLKENISCNYCRQYAYELMRLLLRPEAELVFDWMLTKKEQSDNDYVQEQAKEIFNHYLATPLADVQPTSDTDPCKAALIIAKCLKEAKALL